jgi:cold shock CspA family protein
VVSLFRRRGQPKSPREGVRRTIGGQFRIPGATPPTVPFERRPQIHYAAVVGTVESWSEEGWGALRTPDGLSVFCHFSQVDGIGYRSLVPGSAVYFDYERPGQDGCDARVLTAARPAKAGAPNAPLTRPRPSPDPSTSAYTSDSSITWDDE